MTKTRSSFFTQKNKKKKDRAMNIPIASPYSLIPDRNIPIPAHPCEFVVPQKTYKRCTASQHPISDPIVSRFFALYRQTKNFSKSRKPTLNLSPIVFCYGFRPDSSRLAGFVLSLQVPAITNFTLPLHSQTLAFTIFTPKISRPHCPTHLHSNSPPNAPALLTLITPIINFHSSIINSIPLLAFPPHSSTIRPLLQ